MEKKFFLKSLFASVFAFFAVTTTVALKQQNMSLEEEFLLKNVEALSNDEMDGDSEAGKIKCYVVIKDENSGPYTVPKCSVCMDVTCSDYTDSKKCKK